jgi:guanylate kinase
MTLSPEGLANRPETAQDSPPGASPARTGLLFVVSGPSAVGKDTVLDALLSSPHLPYSVQKCVTTTTRAPRPKNGGVEEDGVDYHFVSPARFNEMVSADEFLEYAEVHGVGWYGTPRQWVADRLMHGTDVILKIDVQGGLSVKNQSPDAVLVFLQPPSIEELERRLRGRRTETEDSIAVRLLNARSELAHRKYYDYAVVNDTVDGAVDAIRAIILAEHFRIKK